MLSQREIMRLRLHEGDEVVGTAGTVWLTFGGRDFILESGQTFTAPAQGEAMLQGLGKSLWDFRVRVNAGAAKSRSANGSWRARINGWLHSGHQSGGTRPRAV